MRDVLTLDLGKTDGWYLWSNNTGSLTTATARLRIDFEITTQPTLGRNRAFLKSQLQPFTDWGRKNNVPIYSGEYGAGAPCFQNNKGGLLWVADVIALSKEFGFHTTYHAYHEDSFGWFYGSGALSSEQNANLPLMQLVKQKFGK